jgi:hypothetical protein
LSGQLEIKNYKLKIMEKITINAELLLILDSKREWINKIPRHLPEKTTVAEQWVWLDKNGNVMAIGEDFCAAEKLESYPVKVYRLIRCAEALKNIHAL